MNKSKKQTKYDETSLESVLSYTRKLLDKSLREALGDEITDHNYSGKGSFGQILERYYFGYMPNSVSEADFEQIGYELKSSPLKKLKNGEFRAKERLVLSIINYLEIHKEDFYTSSFWEKNSNLLLIFYLHEQDLDILDYLIKIVDVWDYPEEDLLIIKRDWNLINEKIKNGLAHELSEGDTLYLGACTKGSTAKSSMRTQPFNNKKAKQRAFSLKTGYVNHILANLTQDKKQTYGKIIDSSTSLQSTSFEDIVVSKFKPFYGNSINEITETLGLDISQKAKNYFDIVSKTILGIDKNKDISEFKKADIILKTVRLKENGLPKEDLSFPSFKYVELIEESWDSSNLKDLLEKKFFFVFYQYNRNELLLKKVQFWNMCASDIEEVKTVWKSMRQTISDGKIVKFITSNGTRKNYFPKKSEHRISHVRPHARYSRDTYLLPVADKLTGLKEYTKHSFWLNASYIRDEIYGKS